MVNTPPSLIRSLFSIMATDLEAFRLKTDGGNKPGRQTPKRRRQRGPFIRGPLPLDWFAPVLAMQSPGPLRVALALFYQSGLERTSTVRVTSKLRKLFNLSHGSARRALEQLEAAELVIVDRHPGRCHVVTICRSIDE